MDAGTTEVEPDAPGARGHLEGSQSLASRVCTSVRANWLLLVLMAGAAVVAIAVRHSVFPFYSPNRDEPVYVLQAKALLEGRLTLPLYHDLQFFQPWLTGVRDGRLIFEFPPGWPAVLALSSFFTGSMVPALAAVAALVVLAMYLFAREASGRRDVALVAAAFTVATPMVIIQSGLFVSYMYTLALGLFAGFALLRGGRTGRARDLVVGGLLLGLIFLTRPFDALLWGIPFVLFVVVSALGGASPWPDDVVTALRRVGWTIAGFVPPALVMAAFNAHVSGSPTTFPIEAADPLNTFGFGVRRIMVGAVLIPFSKHDSLEAVGDNFRAGPAWILGSWVGIALALVGVYFARRRGSTYVMLGLIATFAVGYFFYWGITLMAEGAPLGGPQYYLPMVVPFVVLGATALVACWRWKPAVAILVAVVLVVVSAPKMRDHLDVNRELSKVPYGAVHRALEDFDQENTLVFVPVGDEPFLLTGPSFAANSPTLDGDRLYAADLAPQMIDLVESTTRTPYRVHTDYRQRGEGVVGDASVERLRVARSGAFTVSLHIVNTVGTSVVTAFLDTGQGLQTAVLDRDSMPGARYDIEWTIAAPVSAEDGTVEMLPGHALLRAGVRFGPEVTDPRQPDDAAAAQYEYVTRTDAEEIAVLLPPRRKQVLLTGFGRLFMAVARTPSLRVTLSPEAN